MQAPACPSFWPVHRFASIGAVLDAAGNPTHQGRIKPVLPGYLVIAHQWLLGGIIAVKNVRVRHLSMRWISAHRKAATRLGATADVVVKRRRPIGVHRWRCIAS